MQSPRVHAGAPFPAWGAPEVASLPGDGGGRESACGGRCRAGACGTPRNALGSLRISELCSATRFLHPTQGPGSDEHADHQPPRSRLPAVRTAGRAVAHPRTALRRPQPRHLRRRDRCRDADRDRTVRADQPPARPRRTELRRRTRAPDPRGRRGAEVLRRRRLHRRDLRLPRRRHAAAAQRRQCLLEPVQGRIDRARHLQHAEHRRGQHAAGLRQRFSEGALPETAARRPLLRDDGADRAAGGLFAGGHPVQRHAARRRPLCDQGPQDLHHGGRSRTGTEHRSPGAGPHPELTARCQGPFAVHRAQAPAFGRRRDRRAQRRRPRRPDPQDGLQGHDLGDAQFRRARRLCRRTAGRAQPGPRLHVPDDERGAHQRRHLGGDAGHHRLSAFAGLCA